MVQSHRKISKKHNMLKTFLWFVSFRWCCQRAPSSYSYAFHSYTIKEICNFNSYIFSIHVFFLWVNSLYTLENSLNSFHTPKIFSIPSIPLKFQLDPFHTLAVTFSFIPWLSLVANVFYALDDLCLNNVEKQLKICLSACILWN